MKLLKKNSIDIGDNFTKEFHEFNIVKVKEVDTHDKQNDSMMIMRTHTMSSIRKRRQDNLSVDGGRSSPLYVDSPLENTMSPTRPRDIEEDLEYEDILQSGLLAKVD